MKSTTFQEKIIFSAKIFACTTILGILGWLSFAPNITQVGAASTNIRLTVSISEPWIKVSDPANGSVVGKDIPMNGTSYNVDDVEKIYIEKNGQQVGEMDISSITLGEDGSISGSASMPDFLSADSYTLVVVGHTMNRGENGNQFPETVEYSIDVNYGNDAPRIECAYNKDGSCLRGAFGYDDNETTIVIKGDNFDGEVRVVVGGQVCKEPSVSPDGKEVTCTVPVAKDGQIGAQDIIVCVVGKGCSVLKDGFIYYKSDDGPSLPGVPSTGLFRVGDNVVTAKDVMLWGGLIIVLAAAAMLIMIVKTPKKTQRYSARSGASKKGSDSKKNVTYRSSKKSSKKK